MGGLGAFGWPAIALVAVVAAGLTAIVAAIYFRGGFGRRAQGRGRAKALSNDKRLEVLDTTVIDHSRSLVLVRCDRIEHLILTGGPTDIVVENDVRRVRGPASAPPKPVAVSELTQRSTAREESTGPAAHGEAQAAALPEPPKPERRGLAEATRLPTQQRSPSLPAPAATALGSSHAHRPGESTGEPAHEPPAPAARPAPQEQQPPKRDGIAVRRTPHITPAPLAPGRPADFPVRPVERENERHARPAGNGRQAPNNGRLPPAASPWPEPDSVEREIVQALHSERKHDHAPIPAVARHDSVGKPVRDSATTLGDLADRLEEALAREVQAASQKQPNLDFDLNSLNFEQEERAKQTERKPIAAQKEHFEARIRPEARQKERLEPVRTPIASAPEPEAGPEPPRPAERREEAPVISLSSRRREQVDPLEDEMARLLGELTGDSKGR
jgi:hypothetical protein